MDRNNLRKRSDKIKFLNGLQSGRVNVNELAGGKTKIEVWRVGDGEYVHCATGKKFTPEQYFEHIKSRNYEQVIKIKGLQ